MPLCWRVRADLVPACVAAEMRCTAVNFKKIKKKRMLKSSQPRIRFVLRVHPLVPVWCGHIDVHGGGGGGERSILLLYICSPPVFSRNTWHDRARERVSLSVCVPPKFNLRAHPHRAAASPRFKIVVLIVRYTVRSAPQVMFYCSHSSIRAMLLPVLPDSCYTTASLCFFFSPLRHRLND